MIPEKIQYPFDFPLNITVASVEEYPLHFHQDVEILYVLKGEIKLKNGFSEYLLHEGSVFVTNGKEVHGFYKTDKENLVAIIHISNLYFTKFFPKLTLSSYRTFTFKETDNRFSQLRRITLMILSLYFKKTMGYKQKCIDMAIKAIGFLNDNFNFFAIEKNLVVSPHYDDLVLIERMSRIIPYIYEHHSEKISLEDLSKMEHLSTFYISHMIKTCTGLSFRDFLCFARVEYSEMFLLDKDSKINNVAKKVGFSTTAYYEKFFKMWFGRSPEDHKKMYLPLVKGAHREKKLNELNDNDSMQLIRQSMASITTQAEKQIDKKHLDVYIDSRSELKIFESSVAEFEVLIEKSKFLEFPEQTIVYMKDLGCSNVNLIGNGNMEKRVEIQLEKLLHDASIDFTLGRETLPLRSGFYGLDSTAKMVNIFRNGLFSKEKMQFKLFDSGKKTPLLKGDTGLLTSSGIKKPSFYGLLALSKAKGVILESSDNYVVLKLNIDKPCYLIAVYNYNDDTENMLKGKTAFYHVEDIINNFDGEVDATFTISDLKGSYSIKKYSFDENNSIFAYYSKLGFKDQDNWDLNLDLNYFTTPNTDIMTENVIDKLTLNFSLRGLGLQLAIIEPLE